MMDNNNIELPDENAADTADLKAQSVDTETSPNDAPKKSSAPKKKKKKSKKRTFVESCKELVRDRRPWYKRLIVAVLVSLAFTYTLFVFGPLEVFLPNISFYTFTFNELIGPLLTLGVAIFGALTLILFLLRGLIFNFATTVVFSTTLCAYIQCNFMNSISALDGTAIAWETMAKSMGINALLWGVIFVIPFIVHYFGHKLWRHFVTFVSILLVLAQTAGLVQLVLTTDFKYADGNGYLSDEEIYHVSEKKNVIVFLLDRCDNSTIDRTFVKFPELKDDFTDFVRYNNAAGTYSRTFPSVLYFLTGVKTDYTEPVNDYFKRAWAEGTFLPDIKNAGYETRLYTELNYAIKNTVYIDDFVDNVKDDLAKANVSDMLSTICDLTMYRYTPLCMKPFFWAYSGDFETARTATDGSPVTDIHKTDDVAFYSGLREEGLTVDKDSNGAFIFYHMQGSHDPFVMNENGEYDRTASAEQQTAGNLNMIKKYIELLKEQGVYDDTTIIITADHGLTGTITELDYPRTITCMVKYPGASEAEKIETNSAPINHDNIRATVLKYLGIDHSVYGPAVDEVPEDAEITRYFYMSAADKNKGLHRDYDLVTYEITGDIRDFENWKIIDRKRIEYPFYDAK